jgi:thiol-disulfide isomerase/thioredoxin
MKNILKILVVLIFFTNISLANAMDRATDNQWKVLKKFTPQLKFKTFDGEIFDLQKSVQNKLTMVVFWTYWCGICKSELVMLNSLHDKYINQNFQIIGVSLDDISKMDKILAIAKNLKFKNGIYDKAEIVDFAKSKSIPESYLINDLGQVIKIFKGKNDQDDLEEIILKYLPQKIVK